MQEQAQRDRSFIGNIQTLFRRPKLPPLEVTSKPVPVEDMWGLYHGQGRRAGAISLSIHASVICLLFLVGTNRKVHEVIKQQITLIAPDLTPYKPVSSRMGGGGGGDRSPTPPSKGNLPKFAHKQFVPPMAVVRAESPKLVMDPTLVIQPDMNIAKLDMDILGDPLAKSGIASNGPGSGGGIGSGRGGGVGPGFGPGFGPGSGGNLGGGVYRAGGGVSAPTVIYKVEPEFSEEARKAKFQGSVLILIIVDEHGNPREVRVIRAAGFGLDENAVEAVQHWRFNPGKKDGKPVAVQATIEVNFRLL